MRVMAGMSDSFAGRIAVVMVLIVMPALGAGIHVFYGRLAKQDVDGGEKSNLAPE
jgi:hypothetical protein